MKTDYLETQRNQNIKSIIIPEAELAEILKISISAIRHVRTSQALPAYKFKGHWYYNLLEIEKVILSEKNRAEMDANE